ncbi:hypothetical protein [Ancylobacter mangrovi]|uniref:hypothetical protein n=1 Tax=Ancylobacter mangrovi TaxID=2972472 RepID=UPI002162B0F4|nr:hypothetical protein [Ancylobacter mangrovi]MCS0504882.1 hypothetical protein [Ancylobacter mangrovi]
MKNFTGWWAGIGRLPLEMFYRFVREHFAPGAEAAFYRRGNIRMRGAVAARKQEIGAPAVRVVRFLLRRLHCGRGNRRLAVLPSTRPMAPATPSIASSA